jgi:Delta7-sterol 5-desaturase
MEDYKILLPFVLNVLRYFIFAGLAYSIFYVWKRQAWFHRKIQQKYPDWKQHRRDIGYSICSGLIFGFLAVGILVAKMHGYTQLYTNMADYGVGYLVASIFILIFIHDTYFYWTHRLMHHPRLFPYIHKVHHLSHNPSPWTAFAFHPTEALVEAAFFPITVFILPVHPLAAFIFLLYSISMNVLGHTGFEYSPKNAMQHQFLRWLTTPTHHNMHHQHSKGNFGLYFNFWDKIMATNDKNYEKKFEEVKQRTK